MESLFNKTFKKFAFYAGITRTMTCSCITIWGEAYRMELHATIYCEKIFIVSVFSNFTQIKMKMMFSVINKFCNKVFGYMISTRIPEIFTPDCFFEGSFNTKSTRSIHKAVAMTRNTIINNYFF